MAFYITSLAHATALVAVVPPVAKAVAEAAA
jgi:hypothetical protein